MRRCRHLSLLPLPRRHAASGLRLVLADQDRAVDPRSRRHAVHRSLLIHTDGRALDLDIVAVAGAVRLLLYAVRLGRARDPYRARDGGVGGDPGLAARHASGDAAVDPVFDAGAATVAEPHPGASAHPGAAGHGGMGWSLDGGRGPQARAVLRDAAADGAVGEPAWRL